MKDTDFLEVSSYVRVQEKKLLDSGSMDRIADAATTQDALRLISQNSDYDFSALRRPEDYEQVVRAELKRVYKLARDVARKCPAVVEILSCRYDFHNVKVALKAHLQGVGGTLPYVDVTGISPADIAAYVEKPTGKTSLPAYLTAAVDGARDAFDKTKNPQSIDIELDKRQYARMLEQAGEVGNDFVTGYVKTAIDFYNVKTLVRVKSMQKGSAFLGDCLAPGGNTDPGFLLANYGKNTGALALAFAFKNYGPAVKAGMESFEKTGNYSELERLFDNYLIEYVKNAKRVSFGPQILFAYLVSKENEIRQIRIVVACKTNHIPVDTLKERLRGNYV